MNARMLLLRHRLVEYWEGLRCHRPSALEFDTSEKPSNSDVVDCINHADRLGQRARTRRACLRRVKLGVVRRTLPTW